MRKMDWIVILLVLLLVSCSQQPADGIFSTQPSEQSADTSATVFFNDPGEKRDDSLQQMILQEINNASQSIDIATYNFTETKSRDALLSAVKRGVAVRLVIHRENAGKDVVRALEKGGVKIRESQSSGLMHSKFLVIDSDTTISGSANMTPGSFFYDNNFMILIRSAAVNQIFRDEFEEMFVDGKFGKASPVTQAPDVLTLSDGTRLLVRFSPDDSVAAFLVSMTKAAKESIYVLAYSFSLDNLGSALVSQYDAGLDVEVIFEKDKAYTDGGGEAEYLIRSGVPVYMDGSDNLMHEKVIIFDDSVVAAGSYNFTRSADQYNDEQILFIDSPAIADAFKAEFEKIQIDAVRP